jgi:hypothetical protein
MYLPGSGTAVDQKGLIGSANSLTLVPGGYVLNADAFSIREGEAEILSRWREGSSGKANELLLMSETGKKYYLFSSLSREYGNIGCWYLKRNLP